VHCRNIDDVDKTMDEINEQTENMKQIQEALSTPIGVSADIDEVLFQSLSSWQKHRLDLIVQ
jgi:hypothetical protein